MAFFCVVVMLGILTPLVVLCASRIAEALGEFVPIPTLPLESIRIRSAELDVVGDVKNAKSDPCVPTFIDRISERL